MPVALNLQDHRQHHGTLARLLIKVLAQRGADFFLDHAPVAHFLGVRLGDGFQNHLARAFHQVCRFLQGHEAAGDDFRRRLKLTGVLVDGEDGNHDAVLGNVAPLLEDDVAHFVEGPDIDADAAHTYALAPPRAALVELQHVAALHQEALLRNRGDFARQLDVAIELSILAVDGHEVLGPDQVEHQLHLFRAAVTGDVHRRLGSVVVMDVGAAAIKVIDHAEDRLLVAGDDAGGDHHLVAGFDADPAVAIHGDARQRGHRFTLAAGQQHHHLVARQAAHVLGLDQHARGDAEASHLDGDLGILEHAAAHEADLAAMLGGQVGHDLHAMQRSGEAGNQHPPLGLGHDLGEPLAHAPLGGRHARPLGVGGIGEEGQHTFAAIVGQGVQVAHPSVGRRGVELEVARVDHGADGSGDGQPARVDDAVREVDQLHVERAYVERLAGQHLAQLHQVSQFVLLQLAANERQRERRTVNRSVDLVQHVGQGADVVLVGVRQDDGADPLAVLAQISDVRNHHVHAQQFGVGKHETAVDDDDVAAILDRHHVHAELTQASQWNGSQLAVWTL